MIEKSLTFKKYTHNSAHKAQYKLHALRSIGKFVTVNKTKILGNAFIVSHSCTFNMDVL